VERAVVLGSGEEGELNGDPGAGRIGALRRRRAALRERVERQPERLPVVPRQESGPNMQDVS
jgi:hypothetical protein